MKEKSPKQMDRDERQAYLKPLRAKLKELERQGKSLNREHLRAVKRFERQEAKLEAKYKELWNHLIRVENWGDFPGMTNHVRREVIRRLKAGDAPIKVAQWSGYSLHHVERIKKDLTP